jgi:hypothetical protein
MARDFGGDLYDFRNMTDDEVRDVVLDHIREQSNLGSDDIDVTVRNGTVTLAGRVGTDAEIQVAEEIVHDVLGIDTYSNELVVDELRRGTAPEAADDEVAMIQETDDEIAGAELYQSDTAEHLVEDLEGETNGTHDVSRAIRDASAYKPPDGPVGDGYGSREDH